MNCTELKEVQNKQHYSKNYLINKILTWQSWLNSLKCWNPNLPRTFVNGIWTLCPVWHSFSRTRAQSRPDPIQAIVKTVVRNPHRTYNHMHGNFGQAPSLLPDNQIALLPTTLHLLITQSRKNLLKIEHSLLHTFINIP